MGSIKGIKIKKRSCYFFDDMIKNEDFDSDILKIDKKSCKNIDIYYIEHITMEDLDYVKINNANLLYMIIGEVDEYIEEKMEINI